MELTLASKREVVLRPIPWRYFRPLVFALYNASGEVLRSLADQKTVGGKELTAAFMGLLHDVSHLDLIAAPEAVRILVMGTLKDPKVTEADLDESWSIDEVTEVLSHVNELQDFKLITDRLKNSWLPAARRLSGVVRGDTTSAESGTNPSPSKSAATPAGPAAKS